MIPEWPDYRDHHEFMRFGIGESPDIVVQADFLSDRIEFWEKLMADVAHETLDDLSLTEMLRASADAVDRLTVNTNLLIVSYLIILFRV